MITRALHALFTPLGLATLAAATSLLLAGGALADPTPRPISGDLARARSIRDSILEMDLPAARSALSGADMADAALAIERARLGIYEGDYDGAAALLGRSDLASTEEGAELGYIALGCARGMAATVEIRDDAGFVAVRLQDDDDRALVPMLTDVAVRVRETLFKDLGVELPKPLRIDLVRDQFTLAAMTGLPEEAARTTGTVAVAKWGRVTMISPRATPRGYPWLDTLAHEMTHLALSRGTRDKAPLWLQEGVAKREETRWRDPQPLDDFPPIDTVAAVGMERGLGRPLDQLGPSIAMLPTPEQASVAFAEVQSFIRFWAREAGDEALPQLVLRLRAANSLDDTSRAIQDVSGVDFATWDKRWRAYLATRPRDIPPELAPRGNIPGAQEISKRFRLGELLDRRGHHQAAASEFARAHTLVPGDAAIRCGLAAALLAGGDRTAAASLVDKVEDLHTRYGRFWSLHGLLFADRAPERAFTLGISLDPLEPAVACEEKPPPELPGDAIRVALCEAARRVPQ
jgi:hypothetical protein